MNELPLHLWYRCYSHGYGDPSFVSNCQTIVPMHPVNEVTLLVTGWLLMDLAAKTVFFKYPYKNTSKNIAQLMVCSFLYGASDLSV